MGQFVTFSNPQENPEIPQVKDVSPDEVLTHKENLRIIDVRRPDEYIGEYGHIAGAELMTLDTLPQRMAELPKDQTVVFVCRSGRRSAQAAAFALENGFEQVFNMLGGMILWTEKDFSAEEKNA